MDNNGQIENQDDGGEVIDFDPMDWKNQLPFDSRKRAVKRIMGILKRLFPYCEGLPPFRRICIRIEDNIYKTATSRADYLRRIDESILALEAMNPRQSNGANPQQVMDTQDWRTNLNANSRQRIINKMMDIFTRHIPFAGPEDLLELNMIAIGLEVKMYTTATSQSDYLKKISMKMLKVERDYPLQSNEANAGQNPSDQAVHGMQTDVQNYYPGNAAN